MSVPHIMASGMGGVRTAGDLVARMELGKSMKINDAKAHVAKSLGIDVTSICDEQVMRELREELDIGTITSLPNSSRGIEAKLNIEEILGIKINSCQRYRNRRGC